MCVRAYLRAGPAYDQCSLQTLDQVLKAGRENLDLDVCLEKTCCCRKMSMVSLLTGICSDGDFPGGGVGVAGIFGVYVCIPPCR